MNDPTSVSFEPIRLVFQLERADNPRLYDGPDPFQEARETGESVAHVGAGRLAGTAVIGWRWQPDDADPGGSDAP